MDCGRFFSRLARTLWDVLEEEIKKGWERKELNRQNWEKVLILKAFSPLHLNLLLNLGAAICFHGCSVLLTPCGLINLYFSPPLSPDSCLIKLSLRLQVVTNKETGVV